MEQGDKRSNEALAADSPHNEQRAQGAGAQRQPQREGSQDAEPSNTASHGYNGKREYKLLRVGIDSLYLSYYGDLLPGVESELGQRKYHAQSRFPDDVALAQWPIGEHIF